MSEPEPGNRWAKPLDALGEFAGMLLGVVGAIVGGTLLHAHFAPKDALCNTVDALSQQQSTSSMAHCGLYSFLSGMGQIIQWGATLGLVVAVIFLLVMLSPTKPKAPGGGG